MSYQTVTHELTDATSSSWISESYCIGEDGIHAYLTAASNDKLKVYGLTDQITNGAGEDWIPIGIRIKTVVGMWNNGAGPITIVDDGLHRLRVSLSKNNGGSFSSVTHLVDCDLGSLQTVGDLNSIWGLGDLSLAEVNSNNFLICFNKPTEDPAEGVMDALRSVDDVRVEIRYFNRKTGDIDLSATADCSAEISLTITES